MILSHLTRLVHSLLRLTSTLRATTVFGTGSHGGVVRGRLGVGVHGIGTTAHASEERSLGVEGLRGEGLAWVRSGLVLVWHGWRRGVGDLVSHVGATEVAGNPDRVTHRHAVLTLLVACGYDGWTGLSLGLVLQASRDEVRCCDDEGQERRAANGDTDDGTGGHAGFAAATVLLVGGSSG